MKKLTGQRLELLIFTLITLFNLYPFIALRFFPTLDGASHMSNASIINQIVIFHNDIIRQFFMINPEPVPNWTTHLILSVTGLILPAFLAEKVLLIVLLAGIPFAFRNLVRTIAPHNYFYAYLIFPFTHSMFFYFGFYNFCIGILFLFITLTFYLRHAGQLNRPWNLFRLGVLILMTWFSHVLVFGVLLILISAYIVTLFINDLLVKKTSLKKAISAISEKIVQLVFASAIPLLMFFYFFLSRKQTSEISYLPFNTLTDNLLLLKPLIVFNGIEEGFLTHRFVQLIALLFIIAGITWIIRLAKKNTTAPATDQTASQGIYAAWLLLSIIALLGLYFTLPDALGNASYTTYRLGFVVFILAIAWIAVSHVHLTTGLVAAILVMYINFTLISMKEPKVKELEQIAIACNKAADFVEPNSVVLPIYCMDNWFIGHFVDYIAIDKPMVMLYNYECETGFFPVLNNLRDKPNYYLGNPGLHKYLIRFEKVKGRTFRKIDYVFIVGGCSPENTDNWGKIDLILNSEFRVAYKSDFCTLYGKR